METIDRRTRSDADVVPLDLETWFDEHLPVLLEANGELVERGRRHLGLPPLTFEVDGVRRTLLGEHGDDALVLGLTAEQFSDWAQELRTMVAFWTARDAEMHGRTDDFLAWDCVARALLDGWPVHEPGAITFTGRQGQPLDLPHAFTPNDDPADIAHYLRAAGFLHLRGWLDPADMATIDADIERAVPSYAQGDGRSWWAKTNDGADRLVRLQHFHQHSPTTLAMLDGPVWARLREVLGGGVDDLVGRSPDTNCIEALIKPLGVVKGISDVPWHRDCSFGRHTYGCAGTTVGVSVTAGGEGTGQLRVVAGSHRANVPAVGTTHIQDLPVIPLPTEPGDLTVHLSCTLHEAMPPVTGPRKVMYTGFGLRPTGGDDVGRRSPALAELREKAHLLRDQPPSPVATG